MRKHLLQLINLFWLTMATGLLYYLLVQDRTLHLSIPDILDWAGHCTKPGHLFVIGFLPIYLGLIIFGAAMLFIYFRSSLWPLLSHYLKQWLHIGRKS
jgi:hypothetical protein